MSRSKSSREDPGGAGASTGSAASQGSVVRISRRQAGAARHVAPLSLHFAIGGRELYRTELGRHLVEDGRLLVLPEGREVSTSVAGAPESLSVLLSPELVSEVAWSLRASDEAMLESRPEGRFEPIERTHAVTPEVGRLLARLRQGSPVAEPGLLEEQLHAAAAALVRLEDEALAQSAQVPARRAATRLEIFRRLCRARDHLEACLTEPVSLDDLSRVACISPHRLLRLFRDTFGITPHRYLTERRLAEAARLLRTTARPVAEVALACGFASVGSFTTAFHRRFGQPPRRYRGGR